MSACLVPRPRRLARATRLAASVVTLVTCALAAGCGGDDPAGSDGGTDPNTVSTDASNTAYVNANLTVPVGTTVTFKLGPTHDADFENAGVIDFGFGATGTRTFNAAGTYRYRCTAHSINYTSGMVGTITVQ